MTESWPVVLFEEYRIYSISRHERFWSLKVGAYHELGAYSRLRAY